MTKKYYFFDQQTGGHSSHSSLDGLVDMLLEDNRSWLGTSEEREGDRELIESFENGKWTEEEKLNYARMHEYEPIEVTKELFQALGVPKEEFEEFGWN